MGTATLVLASLLALGPLGNVEAEAGVRMGSRLRILDEEAAGDGSPAAEQVRRVELDLEPRLVIQNDARLRLRLSYTPRLRMPFEAAQPGVRQGEMPSAVERASLLHIAALDAERALGRWTLRTGARASYGALDPLDRGAAPDQLVVHRSRIPYQAYGFHAGFTAGLLRRISLNVDTNASMSGGDGEVAQRSLPTQQEVRLDSTLDFEATRRDTYGGRLSLTGSRVDRGSDALTLRSGGRWQHALGRPSIVQLSAGAAVAFERDAPGQDPAEGRGEDLPRAISNVGPWAEGTFEYRQGDRLPSLVFTLGLEPGIDRLQGTVQYRGFVGARSDWAPTRDWQFGLSSRLAAWEPWSGRESGEVSRTWNSGLAGQANRSLGRHWTIGAGLSSTWQEGGREDLASFREVVAMLELNATLP